MSWLPNSSPAHFDTDELPNHRLSVPPRRIVEIDGGTHGTPDEIANDHEREQTLSALGYKIIRVHNADIYENIEGVLGLLLALLAKPKS